MSDITVQDIVNSILARKPDDKSLFIDTRFPFTYAYDFFRMSKGEFLTEEEATKYRNCVISRAEASSLVRHYTARTGQDYSTVIEALALGYIKFYDLKNAPSDFELRGLMIQAGFHFDD